MKYIDDKSIGKKISTIGLGTGRFGTKVSEELSFELLDLFYENGGTVIDTARNYYEWVPDGRGKSEECIGKWIEKRDARDNICLVTKGGVKNQEKVFTYNLSRDNLIKELHESMKALKTDNIDIYLLHRDEPERPVEEIVETMQALIYEGKIKKIGVANWNIRRIKNANEYAISMGYKPFSVIQTWWSLAEYTDAMWNDPSTTHMDEETYKYIINNDYLGMAYTSQCKGFFQKAISNGLENVDDFLRQRIETPVNLRKLKYIESYCHRENISPTAFVNAYITSNSAKGIALVSTMKREQLEDILKVSDYSLSWEVIDEIDGIR